MLAHTATTVTDLLRSFFAAERTAARDGFLQSRRPTATLLATAALLVAVTVSRDPLVIAGLAAVPLALAVASSVPLGRLAARSLPVALASLLVVAPQAVLVAGPSLVEIAGLAVTTDGLAYVLTFTLRVWTSVALLSVLVLTTPFSDVVGALRRLRVPVALVWTVALTYRYLFLFFSELRRLLRARESRTDSSDGLRRRWRDLGRLSGTFLVRTLERGERVHRGMRARGGARPPDPYDHGDTVDATDVLFVACALAVAVAAGVVRWLP
jgi:cobalt/nickel transport system permease protein